MRYRCRYLQFAYYCGDEYDIDETELIATVGRLKSIERLSVGHLEFGGQSKRVAQSLPNMVELRGAYGHTRPACVAFENF